MKIEREWLEPLIFGDASARRFTQDSPIMADVWLEYGRIGNKPLDLLLTPYDITLPSQLSATVLERAVRFREERRFNTDFPQDFSADLRRKSFDGENKLLQRTRPPVQAVFEELHVPQDETYLAFNKTSVVLELKFRDVIASLLPLTWWWQHFIACFTFEQLNLIFGLLQYITRSTSEVESEVRWSEIQKKLAAEIKRTSEFPNRDRSNFGGESDRPIRVSPEFLWMIRLVGTLGIAIERDSFQGRPSRTEPAGTLTQRHAAWNSILRRPENAIEYMHGIINDLQSKRLLPDRNEKPLLYSANINRKATNAVWRSTRSVKADAAYRVFEASCSKITWAIVDSGIDATHPAFRQRQAAVLGATPFPEPFELARTPMRSRVPQKSVNRTRVVATYDFTKIRELLEFNPFGRGKSSHWLQERVNREPQLIEQLLMVRGSLLRGQDLDWSLIAPLIQIPHEPEEYEPPLHEHGTHIAGILGADWDSSLNPVTTENVVQGMCPDINFMTSEFWMRTERETNSPLWQRSNTCVI